MLCTAKCNTRRAQSFSVIRAFVSTCQSHCRLSIRCEYPRLCLRRQQQTPGSMGAEQQEQAIPAASSHQNSDQPSALSTGLSSDSSGVGVESEPISEATTAGSAVGAEQSTDTGHDVHTEVLAAAAMQPGSVLVADNKAAVQDEAAPHEDTATADATRQAKQVSLPPCNMSFERTQPIRWFFQRGRNVHLTKFASHCRLQSTVRCCSNGLCVRNTWATLLASAEPLRQQCGPRRHQQVAVIICYVHALYQ